MDVYLLVIALIGLAVLGMTWMPALTEYTGISYSIIYVAIGVILYLAFPTMLPRADPVLNENITMRLAELVVIISLMGTGIKIDRAFSRKKWQSPLRLLSIAMILCIAATTVLGVTFLGFNIAAAVLLGAVIAPTDPVLASDVQVGPPNDGKKSETKFALSAEAGLNDGLAFPFVWLAITIAISNQVEGHALLTWLAYDLVYKILAGLVVGFLFGKAMGYILFTASARYPALKTREGFLAISLTLLVYGVTELVHGYGFIAVFICAITLRHSEKHHPYHDELHSMAEQAEKLFIAILLILFGGSLVSGIFSALTWQMAAFSLLFLFVIRPVAAYISLWGVKIHPKEKLAISFFGIRGMGSIFYLAYGLSKTTLPTKKSYGPPWPLPSLYPSSYTGLRPHRPWTTSLSAFIFQRKPKTVADRNSLDIHYWHTIIALTKLHMKNLLIILTLTFFASCTNSDEQQKKDTDNALKVATEVSTNVSDTTSYYHTTGDKNQDSALLQLIIRNNVVSGTLQYMPYEKDARRGTLAGEKKGDIINAVWTYTQEGIEDTMSVSFKFKNGTIYQKPNVFKPKLGREVLDHRTDYEIEYKKTEFK